MMMMKFHSDHMNCQPTGLLNAGKINVIYKHEDPLHPPLRMSFYGKPYYENKHPIFYECIANCPMAEHELRGASTLYHLFNKGNLVYVGITKNTWQRLSEHHRTKKGLWDAFVIFGTDGMSGDFVREMECNIISQLNPVLNTQWKWRVYNHHRTF
jgi:hypothetical protein